MNFMWSRRVRVMVSGKRRSFKHSMTTSTGRKSRCALRCRRTILSRRLRAFSPSSVCASRCF